MHKNPELHPSGIQSSTDHKSNYEQIDTIRFLTISIIVWSHSLFSEWHIRPAGEMAELLIRSIVLQAGAISTIIFFIVSGILIRSKLQRYNVQNYINERLGSIYFPWLFIVVFNAVLIMLHRLPLMELWISRDFDRFMQSAYNIMNGLLIYGPYWFVVTYFTGMIILILFKRYSENIYFGLFLCGITLFYSVNFHTGWIDTQHSKAVLAYTFFIWLGFPIHRNWDQILQNLKKLKWTFLIPVLLLMFFIAGLEGFKLSEAGVADPFASNRLSNIIFSLVFFLLLLKMGAVKSINNLNPRKIVYGIYLVNSIVVLELSILLNEYLSELRDLHIGALLGLQILYFLLVLLITYFLVRTLKNSSLRWVIGLK